ncbi:Basic immunoglobulin-like variable motif-containing protein [Trypanosoma conorhini]|uniref:Basic immunoglobulin-like variable motif-containing protein n=1 Tax=Trypanosoma conorhini TaxID=83891 RepID=A0A3R7N4N5_9TRYP|nr:Basic immunoglobulin-like variable motif-containing protein [Trypanosoma conorhini]RNF25360.1 Basic immunoglobulin-like variable motif-containing protein [Trypanosoma conorhini]
MEMPPASASPTAGDNAEPNPPRGGEAWAIDFSLPNMRRKITRRERDAVVSSRIRRQIQQLQQFQLGAERAGEGQPLRLGQAADSEGNRQLQVVTVDDMADLSGLIPRDLTSTRGELEERLCLRLPRLLTVAKQYPRSCGVTSLASIWNYLYTRLGEAAVGAARGPVAQEEIMSILGFAPPFDEISWGPFTGNGTLIRWFHAINRHFGVKGRAYILYKPQGKCRTSCTAEEALRELKRVLRDPHAAVVYHCHNHYMVPIGYQEIPLAQTDFYAPQVPESHTETTVFIGEVSRGRHEAMYARKWSEIVKDLMCRSPQFYNIRRPELGVQTRVPKKKKSEAVGDDEAAVVPVEQAEQDGNPPFSPLPPPATPPAEETAATAVGGGSATPPVVAGAAKRKKTGGGNLHCLICFRSDEVEEHPERYEELSSASSRSRSDSDSDENEYPAVADVQPM